jgi:hypothetical protein
MEDANRWFTDFEDALNNGDDKALAQLSYDAVGFGFIRTLVCLPSAL